MIAPTPFRPDDKAIAALRESVASKMSEKRFRHTAAVESMVARLAALYCPEEENALRAAALLHDITKEYDTDTQLELCRRMGVPTDESDRLAHKTLHARTAAALIPEAYPDFHHETVISAVRWHTTGRAGMTLCERLLYLADYIDDSRLFPDCVRLRALFWGEDVAAMTEEERRSHLNRILITSFDMTIRALINEGAIVSPDTIDARNALVMEETRAKRN